MISSNFHDRTIECLPELDVTTVAPGTKARRVIDIGHDGMGRAVRVPVIVVRGRRDGPVFGITCALHGNELNGIPVVHRLIEAIDPKNLRGTLVVCPVLNIPGFVRNEREYRDGKDLNHLMPGIDNGNESQVYAHRILDRIVAKFEVLIDLHTASFGRVNSLYVRADMQNPTTALMAYLQRPRIILHNPPSDHTLRGAADELGIPAITVEIGDPQVFQPRHIKPTLAGVRAVLCHFEMIPKRAHAEGVPPIVCGRSEWLYTDHGGLLEVLPAVASMVAKGDLIARQRDVFGDLVQEYFSPFDGVVIGKSVNPVSPTGARIMHLGQISTDHDGIASLSEAEDDAVEFK